MASGTSLSGYVLSMTGATLPDSMRSLRAIRSSWFSDETNVPSFWPTNRDSTSARSWRSVPPSHRPPVSPPVMTSVPRGVRARRNDVPDVPTHASRMHVNQYLLVVGDLGLVDVSEF